MATQPGADTTNAIARFLMSKGLVPTTAWLNNFIATVKPNTLLQAQQQTALFRMLSSDLTISTPTPGLGSSLPGDVANVEVETRDLFGPITVQVLDIEDIGRSRWSQVELLESQDRGEMTKGREVIRIVPGEDGNADTTSAQTSANAASSGPHKLLLQDAKGTKVHGFELVAVSGIGVPQMLIGAKLVLRNVTVARGVVLLEPKGVEVLGGKVEVWDRKWKSERKETLKREAGMQ